MDPDRFGQRISDLGVLWFFLKLLEQAEHDGTDVMLLLSCRI